MLCYTIGASHAVMGCKVVHKIKKKESEDKNTEYIFFPPVLLSTVLPCA